MVNNQYSWAQRTTLKLEEIDGRGSDVLAMLKNNTKEAVKLAMKGVFRVEDFKELQGEIEKSPAFKVQINVFESCNPLILCGFDQKLKRECNGWMKVATSDFWRNYGLPKDRKHCLLCGRGRDCAEHLLGYACMAELSPGAAATWKEIVEILKRHFPSHPLSYHYYTGDLRAKFIINPNCEHLGELRLSRSKLQETGLDILIRRYAYRKVLYRTNMLKRMGKIGKGKGVIAGTTALARAS